MAKNIHELSKIASEKLGVKVELVESVLYHPEEVEDIIEVNDNVLVHVGSHEENGEDSVIFITSDYPEYKPITVFIQDHLGNIKKRYDFS
jgi:hypothetical protein